MLILRNKDLNFVLYINKNVNKKLFTKLNLVDCFKNMIGNKW